MKKILPILFCFLSISSFSQDLIVTNISGSMTFGANDVYNGFATIKNTGIVDIPAGQIFVHIYISSDSVQDNSDLSAGFGYTTPTLLAGETKTLPIVANKQINLPIGTYYLIAVADKDNLVQETDDNNNTYAISGFTVTPSNFDFKFVSFSVDSAMYMNDAFKTQYQIENPGNYSSPVYLITSFYLSKDQALDDSDILCGIASNYLNQPLDNTKSMYFNGVPYIPKVDPGQYYIIAKVDSYELFTELAEDNNTIVSAPVTIKNSDIDLEPSYLWVNPNPNSYASGTLSLNNNGSTGAANVQFRVFLSADQSWDPAIDHDTYFYNSAQVYAPGKGSSATSFNFSTTTVELGSYYVIVVVDPDNSLDETNTNNNVIVSDQPIYVGHLQQYISITSANFTSKYNETDKTFALNLAFKNNGSLNFNDYIFYPVTIKDASNVTVSWSWIYLQNLTVDSGQSTSGNFDFSLDKPLPPGDYTVTLKCGNPYSCNADSLSLPLKIEHLVDTLSGKIQGEDGTPITNGKLFLYQKHDDGSVSFTQKITPITSSDFAFPVDWHQYTLYFIPDAIDYPQYVPTIFGKTVTLSPSNFITISKDSAVTFEILKVHTLASGSQTISGNINTGSSSSSSFSKNKTVSTMSVAAPITVLLLDEQGEVVAITQTDASGNYAFTNLPGAKYQVIVPFELDQPALMKEPVHIDVTTESKDVSFNFSASVPVTVVKTLQAITFDAIEPVTYVHAPIALSAFSSSNLPVSYSSSDPSVATIADNQITIIGTGTTTITASQSGNDAYKATEVNQNLVVDKGVLRVIAENKTKNYGEANPTLTFNFDGFKSGEDLSNSGVTAPAATTSANQNSNAGTYAINFTSGDAGNNYTFDFVGATLTINKVDQSITFNSELPDVTTDAAPISLRAQATSGLPVTFNITEGSDIVNLSNATLTLTGKAGTVTVEALQNGDVNHNSALPVAKSFKVDVVLGVNPEATPMVTMSPNPTHGEVIVTAGVPINILTLWDILGNKINSIENLNQNEYHLNLSGYLQGTYLVSVITKDGTSVTTRVVLVR